MQSGKIQASGKNQKPCTWTCAAASDIHKILKMQKSSSVEMCLFASVLYRLFPSLWPPSFIAVLFLCNLHGIEGTVYNVTVKHPSSGAEHPAFS